MGLLWQSGGRGRGAALVALSFKQLDGECKEGLHESVRSSSAYCEIIDWRQVELKTQRASQTRLLSTRGKVKVVGPQENQEVLTKSRWT